MTVAMMRRSQLPQVLLLFSCHSSSCGGWRLSVLVTCIDFDAHSLLCKDWLSNSRFSLHAGMQLIGKLTALQELRCRCPDKGSDDSLRPLQHLTGLSCLVFDPQSEGPDISRQGLQSLQGLTNLRR